MLCALWVDMQPDKQCGCVGKSCVPQALGLTVRLAVWFACLFADVLLGDKAAEEHGDSPAEILLRYHRSLNDASVSLFASESAGGGGCLQGAKDRRGRGAGRGERGRAGQGRGGEQGRGRGEACGTRQAEGCSACWGQACVEYEQQWYAAQGGVQAEAALL